jgi:hypothetical protein
MALVFVIRHVARRRHRNDGPQVPVTTTPS